ncbi:choice-of-anchor H family protein [Thalassotalea sp. 1_MG-2023]|uniref:choice-of-anchor H family protein n=1 Tax=Thalassotalea sp. 1_MG-2023 TaxID=3062680 RepID=UPI0026E19632|nr:choice-of-anchor H family protein [Thalassotalea sp. 1_MG-2023]MDO6428279.1 choice-of-anchor H family protein [Thalassotalea sp. 1_MG-2023]
MTHTITTIAILSVLLTLPVNAASQTAASKSISASKATWDTSTALSQLKDGEQLENPLVGLSREQVKQQKSAKKLLTTNNQKSALRAYHSFSIYQGYAQLIEDYDQDGFFQTFSVTFDADVYSYDHINSAKVYAELYLSKNGGDWIHYYTTEDFIIYGENENDEYEVYTTLNQGYIPEYYDVLIDLYEVGYPDIVATYSANDTNDLYALPLESTDYDPDYVEVVYESESHGHGGSIYTLLALLATIGLLKIRR